MVVEAPIFFARVIETAVTDVLREAALGIGLAFVITLIAALLIIRPWKP